VASSHFVQSLTTGAIRKAWLADRAICELPLPVPVELCLHEYAEDGSFHASIEARLQGSLVRRPHTSGGRDEPFGWDHIVSWTDESWDWLLCTDVALDEATLTDRDTTSGRLPARAFVAR
jgi:hypothetical protein